MKYYPIGTVVTLKGGDRPIMIYGRKQIQAGPAIEWDYVACLYPEGNLGDEYTVFFQHEEVGKVNHMGLHSAAEGRMQQILNQY
ncbi:MAG: DUF4176 domain-containing protein [Candidatus Pelethousia sp.]|nr:DUF4176 domain-containing protein [Candidatus Pelethousia sp.]